MDGFELAVQLLLDYNADVNIAEVNGKSIVSQALKYQEISEWVDDVKFNCGLILTRHIVKIKSAGSNVSKNILQDIATNQKLREFKVKCEAEIEKMKGDSVEVLFYKILMSKNLHRLASLARNNFVVQMITSNECNTEFPIYSSPLKYQMKKGILRNFLLNKVKNFFPAVAKAEGNEKLPRLPYLCIDEINSYLSNNDLRNVIRVCDPFNDDFQVDMCDVKNFSLNYN